jgi:hypothetical protein
MKTSRRAAVTSLIGLLICLSACSEQYSAAAITARVVDLETGKPISGVHVVADWQLQGGLEGGSYLGSVKTMEQTTDESGQFHFPAWGPINAPLPSGLYSNARVQSMAPELILFKPGFKYERLSNEPGHDPNPRDMRSMWDGRTIKLKPFRETSTKYMQDLTSLSQSLQRATADANSACKREQPCPAACQWQNIPNAIRAVGREMDRAYGAIGVSNAGIYGDLIDNDKAYRAYGCLSPVAALGGETK